MKTNKIVSLFAVFSLAAFAQAVPPHLTLHARVTNAGEATRGAHEVRFDLFDAPSGGAALWTEAGTQTFTDGLLTVTLGTRSALAPALFDGRDLFLALTVDGVTLSPRLALTTVPYAMRAEVAASAERLGTLSPADLALASHSHAGVYLPLSPMRSCPGTQKLVGLTAQGEAMCGDDLDTSVTFAGSGTSSQAARADHSHAGVYVPVHPGRCPGSDKMVGLLASGAPVCLPDVDTTTSYTAGAGLALNGTTFSVQFGSTGISQLAARADHRHAFACPAGFNAHWWPSTGSPEGTRVSCSRAVAAANVSWVTAAQSCATTYSSSRLCTLAELTVARLPSQPSHTQEVLISNYWLADRTGDNLALRTNNTSGDDFDTEAEVTTSTQSGFYCCTEGTFFR